jgi:hypothetical protein
MVFLSPSTYMAGYYLCFAHGFPQPLDVYGRVVPLFVHGFPQPLVVYDRIVPLFCLMVFLIPSTYMAE